jgi:hypothetical protein
MTAVEEAPLDMTTFKRELPEQHPVYCPLCGRVLLYAWWDTVDNGSRYHAFVCFGGHSSLWQMVAARIKIIWPSGLHYRYEWGPTRLTVPRNFDPLTGERQS